MKPGNFSYQAEIFRIGIEKSVEQHIKNPAHNRIKREQGQIPTKI